MAKAKGNPQAGFKRKLTATKVPIDLDPDDMPTDGATGATGSNTGDLSYFPRSPTIEPLRPSNTGDLLSDCFPRSPTIEPQPMVLDQGDSQPDSVPDPAKMILDLGDSQQP
eukprot:10017449-Alexandrium_andersonii.AAC.1